MNPREVVRYLVSPIESRKEILKIPYGSNDYKRKKIESWILTEMSPKLLELKEKKEIDRVGWEHNYNVLKTGPSGKKTYPRCDIWWEKGSSKNWLEVKTFRFHSDTGLKRYEKRIKEDLEKEIFLKPPYNFHHLLIVFDDNYYDNGNWIEDLYSLYNCYNFNKEDEWDIELDTRRKLKLFLHFKSTEAN